MSQDNATADTMTLRRSLNDGLFNAALLGFAYVLQTATGRQADSFYQGADLVFNAKDLDNFNQAYFKTLIHTFEKDCIFYTIENYLPQLLSMQKPYTDSQEQAITEMTKFLAEKGLRASYVSGYAIINKYGDPYPYEELLKNLKALKDNEEKRALAIELIQHMVEHRDVFLMKDIAYTRIQPFWQNMSFLLKTENTTDFEAAYQKSFIDDVSAFISPEYKPPKHAIHCCQCNSSVRKSEAKSMSWINDEGVDIARKTSYYWNHNPDSYLCPLCAMIYTCLPLGFHYSGNQGIFINDNRSLHALETNYVGLKTEQIQNEKTHRDEPFYRLLSRLILNYEDLNSKKSLMNIQVIRRKNNRYYTHDFSRDMLKGLASCQANLKTLIPIFYMRNGEYIRVFDETMDRLMRNERLFNYISDAALSCLQSGSSLSFIWLLIMIQIEFFNKNNGLEEDSKMMELAKQGRKQGYYLKKEMSSGERNENKIKGLSFKLINALKSKNAYTFSDTLLRQYMALGKPVPQDALNAFGDEDKFLTYGYGFIAGLNGYEKDSEGVTDSAKTAYGSN
ncbi:type I-B CRISPR-associated protein Cas8b1/Cst1 [Oscillospiraceae bacterium HV4-5-C5C]|nr:type I-B CRISPR-associated protein Cas8b1/Cst1 [Oscillospiraceae bacterium HV4-5-C5C]